LDSLYEHLRKIGDTPLHKCAWSFAQVLSEKGWLGIPSLNGVLKRRNYRTDYLQEKWKWDQAMQGIREIVIVS
jgi:hypothetical protein